MLKLMGAPGKPSPCSNSVQEGLGLMVVLSLQVSH